MTAIATKAKPAAKAKKKKLGGTAKGDKYELLSKAILEREGYQVERAKRTAIIKWKFGKPQVIYIACDFFGAFDLIAFKRGAMPRFIQVKARGANTNGWDKKAIDKMKRFCLPSELWVWHAPEDEEEDIELEIKRVFPDDWPQPTEPEKEEEIEKKVDPQPEATLPAGVQSSYF